MAELYATFYHVDRFVEHTLARADPIVCLAHAVEMHVDHQPLVRLDHTVDLFLEQEGVRT